MQFHLLVFPFPLALDPLLRFLGFVSHISPANLVKLNKGMLPPESGNPGELTRVSVRETTTKYKLTTRNETQ